MIPPAVLAPVTRRCRPARSGRSFCRAVAPSGSRPAPFPERPCRVLGLLPSARAAPVVSQPAHAPLYTNAPGNRLSDPPSPTSRGPAGGSSPRRGPGAGRSRSARHRSDDRDRGQCAGCIRTGFILGHDGSCPAVRTSMPGCRNMFPPKPQRAVPSSRRIGIPLMIGRRRPVSDFLSQDPFYRVSSTWAAASASRR
jgi:hypothetical protein